MDETKQAIEKDNEKEHEQCQESEQCQEYCDGNVAKYYCSQCMTNFCADCFEKEHTLKRKKENHEKVLTPRKLCKKHKLTLQYQYTFGFMCCMCIKEMKPSQIGHDFIEPIDGVASVLREKLDVGLKYLECVAQILKKRIEASDENISSAVDCARSEVRRFFTALSLLLNKQEESFQHQLTSLVKSTVSKPVFTEMKQTMEAIEEIVTKGKELMSQDSVFLTKRYDHFSKIIDGLIASYDVQMFPSPNLSVSINVHKHLLEMVRRPGYISTTFDECRAVMKLPGLPAIKTNEINANSVVKIHPKNEKEKEDTILTPPYNSIPTLTSNVITNDDEKTPLSHLPELDKTLPLEENLVAVSNLSNANDDRKKLEIGVDLTCKCDSASQLSESSMLTDLQYEAQYIERDNSGKENKENRQVKRKPCEKSSQFLSFPRKSRRTEASKELNLCDKLLTELWVSDDSYPFARPVDHKKVPEYYEIVKNPIDLTKIKTKLQTLNYDSVYDFVDDMKLLFDNCYLFNQSDSSIFENGKNLERQFMLLMRESFPSVHYQSSLPGNNSDNLIKNV